MPASEAPVTHAQTAAQEMRSEHALPGSQTETHMSHEITRRALPVLFSRPTIGITVDTGAERSARAARPRHARPCRHLRGRPRDRAERWPVQSAGCSSDPPASVLPRPPERGVGVQGRAGQVLTKVLGLACAAVEIARLLTSAASLS